MKIDFGKINIIEKDEKVISPEEIFRVLPNKNKKFEYLRDVQAKVLSKWFEEENRNNKDTIIKMNTGSGKTVVGLLILKSCLEEGKGPAVYVVPNDYLVNQVVNEANMLGIDTTLDPEHPDYLRKRAILVINIFKLINGRSVFGLRKNNDNLVIGSIVIDDVHAALSVTERQFQIKIPRQNELYFRLLNIFEDSLKRQCEVKYLEIKEDSEQNEMLIPYWTWQEKISQIIELLHNSREHKDIKFSWLLLKDCLHLCKCVVTNTKIEITPNSIPIDKITSFNNAHRRIFMSATLADDTPFATHFGVDFKKTNIITPDSANDIGERLILVPQEINPSITDEEMKCKIKEVSRRVNTVVIVPSTQRAKFWEDVADVLIHKHNINESVKTLKDKHLGLIVLINRYDGIDLPNDSCRLLVLDGLPDVRSKYDLIEERALYRSKRIQNQFVQRIEQGMGRGVRSNQDYCVVMLMGNRLIKTLYADFALELFSSATLRQMQISEEISKQVQGASIDEIFSLIDYSLNRDLEWVKLCKNSLVKIKYNNEPSLNEIEILNRKAFNHARYKEFGKAVSCLQEYVNTIDDSLLKGWIKQQIAEYYNFIDPVESQLILKSAKKENRAVLNPIEGLKNKRELKRFTLQGEKFIEYNQSKKFDENKYRIFINSIIEDLKFEVNTSERFEEAMKNIAFALGFDAERPEKEERRGPDVLWRIGELDFVIIECKNGSTNPIISKKDCNQLNGSINWFKEEFDGKCCGYTPLLVHVGDTFEYSASPDTRIRIMNKEKLELFKKNVINFSKGVVERGNFRNSEKVIQLLRNYKLLSNQIIDTYTIEYRFAKR